MSSCIAKTSFKKRIVIALTKNISIHPPNTANEKLIFF